MRAEWAVTAAEHLAAALRVIGEGGGIEAALAAQDAGRAYRWVLYSIGTIPSKRTRSETFRLDANACAASSNLPAWT